MGVKGLVSALLTRISPELNTRILYYYKYGRKINLKDPKEFHEKLLWLKIYRYNNDPLVKQCADKWRVREYVTSKNCGAILNELYGVYNRPEEINWDILPDSFAIKSNVGCGSNIIVPDKSQLDRKNAVKTMHSWEHKRYGLKHAELQYEGVERKILVEKYLQGSNGVLPDDYKLYCFNGKVRVIMYLTGREYSDVLADVFYDRDWNYMGVPIQGSGKIPVGEIPLDKLPPRPESLDEMIRNAELLSQDFPFVRVDFYDIDGRAVFGEMTFTPQGSFDTDAIPINGKDMGEYIHL